MDSGNPQPPKKPCLSSTNRHPRHRRHRLRNRPCRHQFSDWRYFSSLFPALAVAALGECGGRDLGPPKGGPKWDRPMHLGSPKRHMAYVHHRARGWQFLTVFIFLRWQPGGGVLRRRFQQFVASLGVDVGETLWGSESLRCLTAMSHAGVLGEQAGAMLPPLTTSRLSPSRHLRSNPRTLDG